MALYGPRSRWSMTERRAAAGRRTRTEFTVGPSALRWEDDGLTIDVDETAVPHLSPIRGRIRVTPTAFNDRAFALDASGRHFWRPIAPAARIEVAMASPAQNWSGAGYLDMNWGAEPIEQGFTRWDWSRAALGAGRSAILYDAARRDGSALSLALRFGAGGGIEEMDPPPRHALPRTLWRVPRAVQADAPDAVREVRRLEDAPFYARAELTTRLFGEDGHAVHETLDGDRFATRWVKLLLPWRMPRAIWGGGPRA